MDFGRSTESDLSTIDFSLPSSPAFNSRVLTGKPDPDFRFYLGAAKTGHDHWRGKLYPAKTKQADNLKEYQKLFNYVEFNGTFYNPPKPAQVLKWVEQIDRSDFKFCPKFTRAISHMKRLRDVDSEVGQFFELLELFKPYLGVSFIQMPDSFKPDRFEDLDRFAKLIPHGIPVHIELRNELWFPYQESMNNTFEFLRRINIGTVITDCNDRRDTLHMYLTTPTAFIRFNGNDNHPTDRSRMEAWSEQIKAWRDQGLKEAYFTLHQPFEEKFHLSVATAKDVFRELLDS
ncbi:DUF72 domain-containing protein [Pedobacter sp. SYSU D00535]|uniref:DUF72 domain-containing protein n=1 Tax=Pedobacter sp. SYSU D00535 TaxID=2810308 RepID=UPI001A96BBC3|nr:DUF72 domain-containing protein [Pedobacter sp. SYSU D00535]